jgi:hypothetical protein
VPDAIVIRGEKLTAAARNAIDEAIDLADGETVKFFYADSLLDYSSGYVVTDRRVASFEEVEGRMVVFSCTYAELEEIEVRKSDTWIDDTVVTLHAKPPKEPFVILLSTMEGGDTLALKYIEDRMKAIPDPSGAPPPD